MRQGVGHPSVDPRGMMFQWKEEYLMSITIAETGDILVMSTKFELGLGTWE